MTTDKSSPPAHYLPSTHLLVLQHGDGLPHHARAVQAGHLAQAGHGAGQGDHCTVTVTWPRYFVYCNKGPRQADQEDAGRGEEEEPGRGQAGQEGEEEGGGRGAGGGARDQGQGRH